MRIIAGSAKGVRLAPVPPSIRPMSDRAREGLFSSLGPDALEGAHVLDLFAGTGAAGIEALSRGAAAASFVDRARPAVEAIKRNLAIAKLSERAEIFPSSVGRFVRRDDRPGAPYDLVSHGKDGREWGRGDDGDLWNHDQWRAVKADATRKSIEDTAKILQQFNADQGQYPDSLNDLKRMPAHKLLERISVERRADVVAPRAFRDYAVGVNEAGWPDQVTLTRLVEG